MRIGNHTRSLESIVCTFTTSLTTDGKLTVAADATATPGATQSIPITLDYGNGALHAGITVRAVPSTRPLARSTPPPSGSNPVKAPASM